MSDKQVGRPSDYSKEMADLICEKLCEGESLRANAIYVLRHPETKEIRYAGKASNPNKRLLSHINDMYRRDYPVYRWMRKLKEDGLCPELIIVGWFEDWVSAEQRLIEVLRARGCNLLNVAPGGDQPYCSNETRSQNGKNLCSHLRENPELMRLRSLKARLVKLASEGSMTSKALNKILDAGKKHPDLLGSWSLKVKLAWDQS